MVSFLIGSGRCGSTMLYKVLAGHPDVRFLSNVDDRVRLLPGTIGRCQGMLYRHTPARWSGWRLRPSEGQRVLAREVSPALVDPFRDLTNADLTPWMARRVRDFFDGLAADRGGRVVHKFTGWPRVALLHEVFPRARFVHIVRDGRAVANSWLQTPWWRGHLGEEGWGLGPLPEAYAREWDGEGRCLVHLAAIGWKMLMDAFEEARAGLAPDLWLQVRYEDLLADPRKQVDVILDFLGLPWTAAFERGFLARSFTADRLRGFQDELTPDQLARLNRSLGVHLGELGYRV
ncbi:sulfotransferase [Sphaerisporangium sp. TRM90804]|uniref:sulfotransferase family protein n=1 Tax=Sphaerisporangium sp. TRM90804 TaxID=3031113 RepID=UPI00244AD5A0|nr:sulfotransferase [Sphaerisporangium sp. TRM90804]MDH2423937.1 sulfotransferase [Sphaerisporangium sp. TRM90804]